MLLLLTVAIFKVNILLPFPIWKPNEMKGARADVSFALAEYEIEIRSCCVTCLGA